MNRIRARVREFNNRRRSGRTLAQLIQQLNPILRGWGNYFRSPTSDREFLRIDTLVVSRLRRWHYRRGGQRRSHRRDLPFHWYHGHGLYRLRGTVRYPVQATPVRSPLSRVRENRTHVLKGGS